MAALATEFKIITSKVLRESFAELELKYAIYNCWGVLVKWMKERGRAPMARKKKEYLLARNWKRWLSRSCSFV